MALERLAHRAYIGLGANLAEPEQQIALALDRLRDTPGVSVVAVSSLYQTAPILATGPDYVNAVAELAVRLAPHALLEVLLALEAEAGRRRTYPNAPRELDLDLLLYGDSVLHDERLEVPHPRLHLRAFVLVPLLELAPGLVAPGLGKLAAWRPAVADQTILRLGSAGAGAGRAAPA